MKKPIIWLIILSLILVLAWLLRPYFQGPKEAIKLPDAVNATYTIDGKEVKLINGRAESEVATGSAEKLVTTIFGQPSVGDLNGDGVDDMVMFATQTGAGSGTFYYALVAVGKDGGFQGLSGVLLGDRIAPQSILIKDNVAMVNFADRKTGEPMTTSPSVGVTKYLVVENNSVKEFNLLNKGEQLFVGNLIMAHEARIFTPCGGTAHWVVGSSAAYSDLMNAYTTNKSTTSPYASVYAVISGIVVSTSDIPDELGKDYNYGIDVKNLLKAIPTGSCGATNS